MTLDCLCCGLELDEVDVALAVERRGVFDGYCRDCEPDAPCPCEGDVSADEQPLGTGQRTLGVAAPPPVRQSGQPRLAR